MAEKAPIKPPRRKPQKKGPTERETQTLTPLKRRSQRATPKGTAVRGRPAGKKASETRRAFPSTPERKQKPAKDQQKKKNYRLSFSTGLLMDSDLSKPQRL